MGVGKYSGQSYIDSMNLVTIRVGEQADIAVVVSSVTRLGNLLDFVQVFEAFIEIWRFFSGHTDCELCFVWCAFSQSKNALLLNFKY